MKTDGAVKPSRAGRGECPRWHGAGSMANGAKGMAGRGNSHGGREATIEGEIGRKGRGIGEGWDG